MADPLTIAPLPPPIELPLTVLPEQPCPYLPGRVAQSRAFSAKRFPPDLYHRFMDAGFRRAGRIFYQPACPSCQRCVPLRVPVDRFRPDRSQRRCRRRNTDLVVTAGEPRLTDEKQELYQRYVSRRHGTLDNDATAVESFLYKSPVHTLEVEYRDRGGRLLAVGICDVCAESVSSVYFYFDPEEPRRGLGTFGALTEIDIARRSGIPHYYLGFWIKGCRAMEYKSSFRPCELLLPDGRWHEMGYAPAEIG